MSTEKSNRSLGATQGKSTVNKNITDTDKKIAKDSILKAFQIAGLTSEDSIVCPNCGNSKKGKIKVKTSAKSGNLYWHCFPCGEHGDAIELLTKFMNYTFVDAINLLLDRDPLQNSMGNFKVLPKFEIAPPFLAKVNSAVYDYLLSLGSADEAVKYYGVWHIAPEAVIEAGSVVLVNARKIQNLLIAKFSKEELIECGVLTKDKAGRDFFLFNSEYNVVEPHRNDSGSVVGMQFRPSPQQMLKVKAHKDWKKRWSGKLSSSGEILDPSEAWEEAYSFNSAQAGEKIPYVTPFLSLKGAGRESLVGCGLWRIGKLPKGSKIYVVEGFKDLLAARTLGVEAYAIPGVGVMPSDKVCKLFKSHHMVVMLDGDEAGAKGRAALMAHFKEQGITSSIFPNQREGMDVADILVEKFAHTDCSCSTCKAWVISHPYDKETCGCRSCKA
jgi:5S rRNA maturation endonuclease (ribonuclease M5)